MKGRPKTRTKRVASRGARLEARIQDSCFQMLVPLAGILLRAGIGAGEFSDLCRRAYVHMAASQLASLERRPNVSRIAVATGLTRQEVARLLKGGETPSHRDMKRLQRANRVLAGWYTDSRLTLRPGVPKPLPLRGPGSTFERLVRKYGGDVPPRAVLDELRRAAAVRTLPSGAIQPTRRFVEYGERSQKALQDISQKLQRLTETLRHNLDEPAATLFEGVAVTSCLRAEHFPIAVQRLSSSAKRFLSATNSYFGRDSLQGPAARGPLKPRTLGVGVFLFSKSPKRV
jgi:Family of unknown function (DUF6502)